LSFLVTNINQSIQCVHQYDSTVMYVVIATICLQ